MWRFIISIGLAGILLGFIGTAGAEDMAQNALPAMEKSPESPVGEETGPQYASPAVLTNEDCGKCHVKPLQDIEDKGMAHKTKVTCIDCHQTHPPDKWGAVPRCSNCHSGKSHFELIGCFDCHYNPHTPLRLKLSKDMTDPCLTCHEEQIAQLRQHQSYHTVLACSACHFEHGLIPLCGRCHKPHIDTMTEESCHECHKAHMPLVVTYGAEVSSEECGSCHREAFQRLAESPARHRALNCSVCHVGRHKMIPECRMCHGLPHPANIHDSFPSCGECHGVAHDLTPTGVKHRWPRVREGVVGEEERK